MNDLLLLISLIALIKLMVEEALRPRLWLRLIHAALFGLFLALIHPICLSISKPALEAWVASHESLQNATLFVMADLALCLLLVTAHEVPVPDRAFLRYHGVLTSATTLLRRSMPYMPPLLAFPALFYLRMYLLYSLPGTSFIGVTAALIGGVVIWILTAPWIGKALGIDLRELSILFSLVVLAIVVGAGAMSLRIRNYSATDIDPSALWTVLAIGITAGIGYLLYMWKNKKQNKIRSKQ